MNRAHFMAQLRDGLSGLHHTDISDIIADYERHFADGAAALKSQIAEWQSFESAVRKILGELA